MDQTTDKKEKAKTSTHVKFLTSNHLESVLTVQAPSEETSQYTDTGAVWLWLGKIVYTPFAVIPEQSSEVKIRKVD